MIALVLVVAAAVGVGVLIHKYGFAAVESKAKADLATLKADVVALEGKAVSLEATAKAWVLKEIAAIKAKW